MNSAIEFENISKQYRLGLVSTRTLKADLNRWWAMSVRGKEDPYLKIGETNDRSHKGSSDYVWALKDINFKVEQGDVVGIIGKNGAGKSTLLKLLSKVTGPTTGEIRAHGRIGSLLEVGTGFHPEMTGRENIFMNGAILGMTKQEIRAKLDEIVDFSGCERYLDTPVKRYSSGMMVRLGFAVAAHLDPEILVVDEVLAVGDAEFQKKAIGKMQDVSKGEGRTVLFVSHNMASIRKLCTNCVVLKNGRVEKIGGTDECVDYYIGHNMQELINYAEITDSHRNYEYVSKDIELLSVRMLNDVEQIATDEPLEFEIEAKKNRDIKEASIEIMFNNQQDVRLGSYLSDLMDMSDIKVGDTFRWHVTVRNHNFAKGRYTIGLNVGMKSVKLGLKDFDVVHNVLTFNVAYLHHDKQDAYVFWPQYSGSLKLQGEVTVNG